MRQVTRPLLIFFHGFNSNAEQQINFTALDTLAARENFWLIFAESLAGSWSLARANNPDLGYVDVLLEDLASKLAIDPNRMFVAGHSNGAQFVYRLAEFRANVFAAFGVFAGSAFSNVVVREVNLNLPAPLAFIHGAADLLFPWENAEVSLSTRRGARDVAVQQMQCQATMTDGPVQRHFNCLGRGQVLTYLVPNMGHFQWPSADSSQPPVGLSLDGNDLLWSFFLERSN